MTSRHTITTADQLYAGNAYHPGASPDGRRGILLSHMLAVKLGAVAAVDADGVCAAQAVAGAANLAIAGALASGGSVTFDVPRSWQAVSSAAGDTTQTVTVTGADDYGVTVVETKTLNGTTPVFGAKAFKTVASVRVSAACAGSISAGSSTVLGLPVKAHTKGDVLGCFVDGVPEATLTVVAGLSASTTATATNGDVRGTVTPNTAPNGAKQFTVQIAVTDHASAKGAYGVAQYGG